MKRMKSVILALASVGALGACGSGRDISFIGTPSASASVIITDSTTLKADGVSYASLTVEVRDNNQNLLPTGGNSVSLATSRGVLSDVIDHNNGRYTATIKSTQTGPATVTGSVEGSPIPQNLVITFTTP
jgi:adhesin/invasin